MSARMLSILFSLLCIVATALAVACVTLALFVVLPGVLELALIVWALAFG